MFQRYYELIRHQKNHCFKEENNKKSAKAQIAAAQIAQSLSSEDSNSSIDINNAQMLSQSMGLAAAAGSGVGAAGLNMGSPNIVGSASGLISNIPGLSTSPTLNMLASPQSLYKSQSNSAQSQPSSSPLQQQSPNPIQQQQHHQQSQSGGGGGGGTGIGSLSGSQHKYECDKCNLIFPRYELFKEHQLIHIMNPNLFLTQSLNQAYGENTPFGILQNIQNSGGSASASAQAGGGTGTQSHSETIDLSQKQKRKYSESSDDIQDYENLNKKIKHDQFDFLYQYFLQNETNDDMKKNSTIDFETLYNYYQANELKKKGNFDFLYKYYVQNEKTLDLNEKPTFEFLFQYYQIQESKKFFQLDASPQKNDFMMQPKLMHGIGSAAAINSATQNSSNTNNGSSNNNTGSNNTNSNSTNNSNGGINISSGGGSSGTPSAGTGAAAGTLGHNQVTSPSSTSSDHLMSNIIHGTTAASTAAATATTQHHGADLSLTAAEKQNNKRLRTTILPEQLNFLYECYQSESNPSRKMLEEISKKVNLKKRVVQVIKVSLFLPRF